MTIQLRLCITAVCAAAALALQEALAATDYPPVKTPRLTWGPCTDAGLGPNSTVLCATAEVPLDYRRPTWRNISLALIKHPATGEPSKRLGSVFFNPGGPGGSGIQQLQGFVDYYVPAAVGEVFDIVNWDPRGIGLSTSFSCFADATDMANFFGNKSLVYYYPTTKEEANAWLNKMQNLSKPCADRNQPLINYLSTADTARDLDVLRAAVGDEKLSYIGISYGTLIGATYANIFPDRVRALVLDSNVDAVGWFANSGLSLALRIRSDLGSSATWEQFLRLCGEAGPERCDFSAGSYAATRAKWLQVMAAFQERGYIGIPGLGDAGSWYVGSSSVLQLIRTTAWADLAITMQDLWLSRNESSQGPLTGADPQAPPDQGWAVYCSEAPRVTDPDAYWRQATTEQARSNMAAWFWTWLDSPCVNWPGHAKNKYTGPWNKPTAAGILVIGIRYDPETDYMSSVAVATEQLANATLLTVDGYGHSAFYNPSTCANEHVVAYLTRGVLPPQGTVCAQDCTPFMVGFDECYATAGMGGQGQDGVGERRRRRLAAGLADGRRRRALDMVGPS